MLNRIKSWAKTAINGPFGVFGLHVTRAAKTGSKGADKYFNTGSLTPLQENSRELYERFYGDHAALAEYYDPQRLAFFTAVSQHLREGRMDLEGKDVLDAGCGTGHLMAAIRNWAKPQSTTGCDFSSEAVIYAQKCFPDSRFFQHDIYHPWAQSYDVVFCTEVLEHLERPFVALKNLETAARPGGVIVITVPNGRLDVANEHINFWSPESWTIFVQRECSACEVRTYTILNGRYNLAIVRKPPALRAP